MSSMSAARLRIEALGSIGLSFFWGGPIGPVQGLGNTQTRSLRTSLIVCSNRVLGCPGAITREGLLFVVHPTETLCHVSQYTRVRSTASLCPLA